VFGPGSVLPQWFRETDHLGPCRYTAGR
jgi:hypothetical protein